MISYFLLFGLAAKLTRAVTATATPYTYVGCWAEPSNVRALTTVFYASDSMTLEYCAGYCAGVYKYWGVEYGRECYCGNTLSPGSLGAPAPECNSPCAANSSETCGGSSRLSLYSATRPFPQTPTPSIIPTIGPYSFSNCQTEGTFLRALTNLASAGNNMTNELCASFCAGYRMFGTEYGRECYCGDTLSYGSIVAPLSDCSFPCGGASQDLCGAALRLNLYALRSISTSKSSSTTKSTSMSLIQPSSSMHSSSSSSSKHAVLTSNSGRISSTTLLTSSHQTTSSTKTSMDGLPAHTLGWSHIGCFLDVDARGDFPDQDMTLLLKSQKMNPALCISAASARKTAVPVTNYHYVGLEHGRDCYAATAAPAPIRRA
ncbi:WSC domain-containing protein [Hyaloscypha sp. PMI_1271]|nr:WSC domain-containing protein [Hyaloscypha sp. PMI_1271]